MKNVLEDTGMLYMIDTANTDSIRRCVDTFPIDGVTTNPTLVAKEKTSFLSLTQTIRQIIGDERMLHIQVTANEFEKIVQEAKELQNFLGGNLYIKIPISKEGLQAAMALKRMGMKVTMTAIFTQQQALMAAKAGADFVAPYVNRLDNIVSDGVNVVSEIVELFNYYQISSKVLAASFKNVEQVHKTSMAGAHAVTVNPEILESLIYHPLTICAIDDFTADWKTAYGNQTILNMFRQ